VYNLVRICNLKTTIMGLNLLSPDQEVIDATRLTVELMRSIDQGIGKL